MKTNGQHHHSTSLVSNRKDTNKSRHCIPFADNSDQPLADANTSLTVLPTTTFPETDKRGNRPKVAKLNNVVSDQIVGQNQNCGSEGTIKRILQANPILATQFGDQVSNPLTRQEHYNHPLWQKKRLAVLERDGWICRHCKASNTQLQIHHLYYNRNGHIWEVDDEALVTLCNPCHKIIHQDLAKLSGIVAFQILTVELDLLTLNLRS